MSEVKHGGVAAVTKILTLVKTALKGKVDVVEGKGLSTNDLTDTLKSQYDAAQANVIESVSVNGTAQEITEKSVNIAVPTKTSDITNDSDFQTSTQVETAITEKGYQTADDVQSAIDTAVSRAYKACGSIAFADLPAATKANLGKVYNITDDFTTTEDFLEGAGVTYPAGTNVAIVLNGTTYHYDVMAGFVDTSEFLTAADIPAEMTAEEVQAIWDGITV